jgi:hypothetical protein
LTRAARGAIRQAEIHCNIETLRQDLKNDPRHVFGDHSHCRVDAGICNPKEGESNFVPMLEEANMLYQLYIQVDFLVRKADRLNSMNQTTNLSKGFNSLVAKYIGGTRVDHSKCGGYSLRVTGAAIICSWEGLAGTEVRRSS